MIVSVGKVLDLQRKGILSSLREFKKKEKKKKRERERKAGLDSSEFCIGECSFLGIIPSKCIEFASINEYFLL